MPEPILSVSGLTKTFKLRGREDVRAVRDVTFDLLPGECLGLIGESGSGKTTLVHLITGLTPATSGSVVLDGLDVTKLKGKALRAAWKKMQVVFQTPTESFDPRRTLGDGICESMRNNGLSKADARKRAGELLERCGLPADFAKRYPHEVSGGQCQRAAIARALAIEPKLLICDEATSALDVDPLRLPRHRPCAAVLRPRARHVPRRARGDRRPRRGDRRAEKRLYTGSHQQHPVRITEREES